MKKLLMLCACALAYINIWACNSCGTSGAGTFLGLLPQDQTNFVGLNWRYQGKKELSPTNFTLDESAFHFNQLAISGAYSPLKKWQLSATIPLNFSKRSSSYVNEGLGGLGDLLISNNVYLKLDKDTANRFVRHSLMISGGIQLPTGNFDMATSHFPASFQIGTGSTNFLGGLTYTITAGRYTMNVNFSQKINTQNKEQYRFGNEHTASIVAARSEYFKNTLEVQPFIGFTFERLGRDHQLNAEKPATGGHSLLANVGMRLNIKQYSFSMIYAQPLFESYEEENYSELKSKDLPRVQVSFNYLINTKKNKR